MSRYSVLLGRIQQQLRDLQLEYDYALEQADLARSTQIDAYWIAAGDRIFPGAIAFLSLCENLSELGDHDCEGAIASSPVRSLLFLGAIAAWRGGIAFWVGHQADPSRPTQPPRRHHCRTRQSPPRTSTTTVTA